MTIKKDYKGLVNLSSLNRDERGVFIKFLEFEKERHQQDIDNISETVVRLRSRK